MGEKKRIYSLIFIMAASALIVVGVAISILYRTALKEEQARLVETAQSQARLIEAVARFDETYSKDYPEGSKAATLSQIIDAHEHYAGFGKTGEFTLSKKEGDTIVFLLSHRHLDLDWPKPISFQSELAEPMRMALLGRSGTVIGLDYRGEVVMAAHEPVAELDLGIVAKIDLSEIRAPFLKAGAMAGLFTVLVVLAGTSLFIRITNPMIKQLETRTVELETMTDEMEREIGRRKLAEEELKKSERRLKAAQNVAKVANYERDFITGEGFWSDEQYRLFGYEPGEVQHSHELFKKHLHPEDRERIDKIIETSLSMGESFETDCRYIPKDGDSRHAHIICNVQLDDEGKPRWLRGTFQDITERKRAEAALIKSERRYRQLVETMNEGLGLTDQNYTFTYANPRFCEMLGYHRDEIVGSKLLDFVHDEYKEMMKDQIARRKRGEEGAFELAWKIKGGDKIYTHASPKALYDEEGCFTGSIGILTDITYRIKAEEALRLSEEKYRLLVENANDAIFILQDGKVKFFNNKAKLIGIELGIDLDRVSFDQYIHPKDRDLVIDRHVRRLKDEKLPDTYAFRLIGKDGQEMWVELNAVELTWEGKAATLNFLRDITVQRKLEQQLQLSQKMEAVGTLAGGVAHDFNNLLMGIQGRTSLMMLELERFHPSFEHLQEIENCIQKAAKLTKQLLGFARGGKYEIKPTDLNDLVENSAQMFGRTKKELSIFKKYEEKLWPAAVDQSQIDQVLLNIFVNAWQAMPEGGDLYIQTKNEILDENFAHPYGVAPGKYIKISIVDTGIGMDDKTMKRVFDPFFTTKEKERGTGLGLASAYGIIKNHDGIITVESTKDKGTIFNLYLPASARAVIEEQGDEQKITVGSETVLLVDDEAIVLDVSVQMLNKMGYEVLAAHSGREAIEIFKQNNDKVAIVILDLIMPGMNGGEVYERLKGIDANVKVLLSSGYSIDGQAAEIINRGCDGFIQKPFKIYELSNKLREIISKQEVKG
jgi:PAS domain S-box-containing protein